MLLRVFALFVALELSGLAHAVTDIYETFTGHEAHQDGDCEEEGAGHECPPGCPNCHCAHAAAVVLAVLPCEASLRLVATSELPLSFVPYAGLVPAGGDPDSLYRPPRNWA